MQKLVTGIILLFFFSQCNESSSPAASSGNETADKLAQSAGLKDFDKITQLEFTFNVDKDSVTATSRHWKWMPKTNDVVFYGEKDSVAFKRYDTSTTQLRELNGQFTNDEYWLIFPFHLVWDKGMTMTDNGKSIAPVTGDSLNKITINYNKTDGFTPGDMYVIYTDDNNKINEWEFHKGGSADPSLMTTWEDYENYDGLKLATNHRSKDGSFRLYFTDVQAGE